MICCGWLAKGAGPTKSPAPPLLPQTPDWEKWLNPGPEAVRCLGGAFAGAVAPGAGAGGADGADLEPVLRAAGQAGDGAARGFADVALRPGSVVFPGPFPQRQRRRLSHQTRSRVQCRQIPSPADLPGPALDSALDGMNPPDRCQRRARKKRQD